MISRNFPMSHSLSQARWLYRAQILYGLGNILHNEISDRDGSNIGNSARIRFQCPQADSKFASETHRIV